MISFQRFPISRPVTFDWARHLGPSARRRLIAGLAIITLISSTLLACGSAGAEILPLPENPEDSVIGTLRYAEASSDDTLLDIARRFDLGHDQIIKANRTVNRWLPGQGARVTLPSLYILPDTPRQGITLNLPELRLYYYFPDRPEVATFPVSIGRMDWRTPLGKTKVVKKDKDPAWYPPASIKIEHAAEGDFLPDMIPGGVPENPLGGYALRLGVPGYLIHGTDARKSFGIGMQVTHGCIRMYPEDIEQLYSMVPVNTPVNLVDNPIKLGWSGGRLYLEIHKHLEPDDSAVAPPDVSLEQVFERLSRVPDLELDREAVRRAHEAGDGIPVAVGRRLGYPEDALAPEQLPVAVRDPQSFRNQPSGPNQSGGSFLSPEVHFRGSEAPAGAISGSYPPSPSLGATSGPAASAGRDAWGGQSSVIGSGSYSSGTSYEAGGASSRGGGSYWKGSSEGGVSFRRSYDGGSEYQSSAPDDSSSATRSLEQSPSQGQPDSSAGSGDRRIHNDLLGSRSTGFQLGPQPTGRPDIYGKPGPSREGSQYERRQPYQTQRDPRQAPYTRARNPYDPRYVGREPFLDDESEGNYYGRGFTASEDYRDEAR